MRLVFNELLIFYIFWSETENCFYDEDGFRIINILDYITPNDLFLFRQDHGCCLFPHRQNKDLFCEIFTEE